MNITKESSKVFLSKYWRCHDWKYEEKERKSQTPPEYVGEKRNQIAESNIQGEQQIEL